MPDGGGHDQGQDAGGDPEDVQHQERLHARGGGRGAEREPVGLRVGVAAVGGGADSGSQRSVGKDVEYGKYGGSVVIHTYFGGCGE